MNTPEYAQICWLLFYFPIVITCFLERVVIYFNVYTKLVVIAWRNARLFFGRDKILIFFFFFNCWIWFVFCFRLKTFARFQIVARFLRHWNTGLVSSSASLTSWGDGASLALADHPSSDRATIKIPYEVDVLHRPALHSIFLYWVG